MLASRRVAALRNRRLRELGHLQLAVSDCRSAADLFLRSERALNGASPEIDPAMAVGKKCAPEMEPRYMEIRTKPAFPC